jgi:hypothetical protein
LDSKLAGPVALLQKLLLGPNAKGSFNVSGNGGVLSHAFPATAASHSYEQADDDRG